MIIGRYAKDNTPEQALEFIDDDELVEVTPSRSGCGKRLAPNMRKRVAKR